MSDRAAQAEANLDHARAKVARLEAQLDGARSLVDQCEDALTAARGPERPTVEAKAGHASGQGAVS